MCGDDRLCHTHMVGSCGHPAKGHHQFEYFQLVERNSGVDGHV